MKNYLDVFEEEESNPKNSGSKRGFMEDDEDAGDAKQQEKPGHAAADDDEVDPLDAFMATLEQSNPTASAAKKARNEPEVMETEDFTASYYSSISKKDTKPTTGQEDSDSENQQDEGDLVDGEGDRRKKKIEPLEPVDHSKINYAPFRKDLYSEHKEIKNLQAEEIKDLRASMSISATGSHAPNPVCSFAHLNFDQDVMDVLRKMEFVKPTPIQAQTIPCALKGRDVIGIAETGSGKTLAYVLPMLVHVMDQRRIEKGDGPIAIIVAPTRELSVQIEKEVYRFSKRMGMTTVTLVGGLSKHEQFKIVTRGCEVLIGTPGRIIDIINLKGTNLQRVTYLVLDEADRMYDMGFEYQMRSIVRNTRPDRQTLLFSATFPPKIEHLARDSLNDPLRVTIGTRGQATANVEQIIHIMTDEDKWKWIRENIPQLLQSGQTIIFVKSKVMVEQLQSDFHTELQIEAGFIHGDMDQNERMVMMRRFRKKEVPALIVTDVAARGLDISSILYVVNYDAASSIETHTHRIGRTGRAGEKGTAITLLTWKEKRFAAHLVEQMEAQGQKIPEDLLKLALNVKEFQIARAKGKQMSLSSGKGKGKGGIGHQSENEPKTEAELDKMMNKKADQEFKRQKEMKHYAASGKKKARQEAISGFVPAKQDDGIAKIISTEVSSDSDSDALLAPGVTQKFGAAAAAHNSFGFQRPPGQQQQQQQQQQQAQLLMQQSQQLIMQQHMAMQCQQRIPPPPFQPAGVSPTPFQPAGVSTTPTQEASGESTGRRKSKWD